MNKETNLEHYKKELKEIFIADGAHPMSVASKIANTLDKNMILRNCNNYYIEDILDWMAQPYKEPVLDDVEKEYLGAVIKPFRNRIRYICLDLRISDYYQIRIVLTPISKERYTEVLVMPTFKKDTMYKRMKLFKEYSLEELGL